MKICLSLPDCDLGLKLYLERKKAHWASDREAKRNLPRIAGAFLPQLLVLSPKRIL